MCQVIGKTFTFYATKCFIGLAKVKHEICWEKFERKVTFGLRKMQDHDDATCPLHSKQRNVIYIMIYLLIFMTHLALEVWKYLCI